MVPVIVRDRMGSMGDAVRLVKLGAYHYFGFEMDSWELSRVVESAVEYHRSRQLAGNAAGTAQVLSGGHGEPARPLSTVFR